MATIAERRTLMQADAGPAAWVRMGGRSWVVRTLMVAAASSLVGVVFALSMWSTAQVKQSLAQWWAWGLLLPAIAWVDRKLPFDENRLGSRVAAMGAAGIPFTAFYLYLFFALRVLMREIAWSELGPGHMLVRGMLGWYFWSGLIYMMIVGGLEAYSYYVRFVQSQLQVERLEKSYSQARLNALRMQLDPHFLFNALNTISSHVERDPRLTRRMIEHLGDLLRLSLETKDRQEVPLAEELAFLDHYLEIQRIRFGEQLQVSIEVEPETRYAMVPSLLLQPLVENAIRHGISKRAYGGTVVVTAHAEGNRLLVVVEDDGQGLPPGWSLEGCSGLGLNVTRERIAGLYPGEAEMSVSSRPEGGTRVEIRLPLHKTGEDDDVA